MDRLLLVWLKYPGLRLGQLIYDAVYQSFEGDIQDLFYAEDMPLLAALEHFGEDEQ